MTIDREELHRLVDLLPESELLTARRYLEVLGKTDEPERRIVIRRVTDEAVPKPYRPMPVMSLDDERFHNRRILVGTIDESETESP